MTFTISIDIKKRVYVYILAYIKKNKILSARQLLKCKKILLVLSISFHKYE